MIIALVCAYVATLSHLFIPVMHPTANAAFHYEMHYGPWIDYLYFQDHVMAASEFGDRVFQLLWPIDVTIISVVILCSMAGFPFYASYLLCMLSYKGWRAFFLQTALDRKALDDRELAEAEDDLATRKLHANTRFERFQRVAHWRACNIFWCGNCRRQPSPTTG